MNYPHRIVVLRSAGGAEVGTTDPETGAFTPNGGEDGPTVLFDGWADCQDMGRFTDQAAQTSESVGVPVYVSKVTVYPEDERIAAYVETGDIIVITWEDGLVVQASVVEGRRLDGAIPVRWVQGPSATPPA